MIHVPRREADYNGEPIISDQDYQLDRHTLQAALATMADFIDSQRQNITVITVGGAVNTLLLQTRRATHDIDFLGTNLNNNERILLDQASKYANRKSRTPLGGNWFNNQTMLWIPANVNRDITEQAIQQNEVVFQRRGLRIIAAPWNYALCGKMNRLVTNRDIRTYDLSDAADYLHRYIERHGGRPVAVAEVRRWAQVFAKQTSDAVIRSVGKEYRRVYRRDGLVG